MPPSLGKTAGKDKAAGKPTYTSLMGLADARRFARRAAGATRRRRSQRFGDRAPNACGEIADFIVHRRALEWCISDEPHYPLLETIDDPAELRRLDRKQLARARGRSCAPSSSIRSSATGGHLSSNLGTVELTIALHYVFDTPDDKHHLGRGPPDLRAQDPHRAPRGDEQAAPEGRHRRLPAPRGKPLRHVRHGAFVDVDLGGDRHGGGGAQPRASTIA